MKIEQITTELIGKRVSCIENGYRVTGTITGIGEDEYTKWATIRFNTPLTCWSGDYNTESWIEKEYNSWARKSDGTGNWTYTELIP